MLLSKLFQGKDSTNEFSFSFFLFFFFHSLDSWHERVDKGWKIAYATFFHFANHGFSGYFSFCSSLSPLYLAHSPSTPLVNLSGNCQKPWDIRSSHKEHSGPCNPWENPSFGYMFLGEGSIWTLVSEASAMTCMPMLTQVPSGWNSEGVAPALGNLLRMADFPHHHIKVPAPPMLLAMNPKWKC